MTSWKGPKVSKGANLEDVMRRTCAALGLPEPLTVEIAVSRTQKHTTGRCWWTQKRIYVTVGLDADRAALEEVMMHEVCHLPAHGHDAAFRARVVKAAKAVFGVDASDHERTPKVYALDSVIRKRLRVKLGLPEKKEWLDPEATCETKAAAVKTLPAGRWVTEPNPWVWG